MPGVGQRWLRPLSDRDHGNPLAASLVLMVLAGVVGACSGPSHKPGTVHLRFPDDRMSSTDIDNYRSVAQSAARAYVKIVIARKASRRREPGYEPALRVVSGASGIIVDPAGYVVTAAHIARSTAFEARVTTVEGREYSARIVHVDAGREMALLKISHQGNRFHAAEPADGVRGNQPVFAIGTPGNRPGAVTVGRVVQPRLERRIDYGGFGFTGPMELAMDVQPGHSGGPVFDTEGSLVGMIIAFDLRGTASGNYVNTGAVYAVPAGEVMEFFHHWAPRTGNF